MMDLLRWGPRYLKRYGGMTALPLALRVESLRRNGSAPFTVPCPDGGPPITLRPEDRGTFQQVVLKDDYALEPFAQSEGLRRRYEACIAEGRQPVIIDCGANIGLASRRFAREFPAARIISIEPGRDNFSLLEANTSHIDAIARVQGAVWSTTTTLDFVDPSAGSASLQVEEKGARSDGSVRAFSIPDLLRDHGVDDILIMKVDIEGAEAEVFSPECPWLDRVALLVIELHDWMLPGRATSAPFLRRIADGHFDCVLSGENLFCFRNPA